MFTLYAMYVTVITHKELLYKALLDDVICCALMTV